MFWMATINPGGRTRRGRRRKLSAWQRMVKQAGGVQAAVKLRRRLRRGRKAKVGHRRAARRVRRLTDWQRMVKKCGGIHAALKEMRKQKRRSAGTRRGSLRRRPRTKARRSSMARTRRRRLPPRGRGGKFRSRRGRRRNPWFGHPRAHRRAALKGWRGRRRRHTGGRVRHRRGGRRRGSRQIALMRMWAKTLGARRGRIGANPRRRRRYRRNAVVPVSWNPRRRRSYRRNSVLPYFAMNPGGIVGEITGKLSKFIDVNFWIETGVPAVGGFVGSKFLGAIIYDNLGKKLTDAVGAAAEPFVRAAGNAVAGAVLAMGVGKILKKPKMADGIWLGTVVSVAHDLLRAILPASIKSAIGMSGLGEDVSSRMREAVARRVEAEMAGLNGTNGMGTFLTQREMEPQMSGLNEFITDTELRRQNGYSASPAGDLRDFDVTRSETTL